MLRFIHSAAGAGPPLVALPNAMANAKTYHRAPSRAQLADESVCIGEAPSSESYLNIPNIIAAAESRGANAVHPVRSVRLVAGWWSGLLLLSNTGAATAGEGRKRQRGM